MTKISALILAVLLVGCEADINKPGECERLGVREDGVSRTVGSELAVSIEKVQELCKDIPYPKGRTQVDCVWLNGDGTITLIWEKGNDWAKAHVECHQKEGIEHTDEYGR